MRAAGWGAARVERAEPGGRRTLLGGAGPTADTCGREGHGRHVLLGGAGQGQTRVPKERAFPVGVNLDLLIGSVFSFPLLLDIS
jgi:hypothetical protein